MESPKSETMTETKKTPATCVRFTEDEFKQVSEDSKATGRSIPTLLKTAYFVHRRVRVLMSKDDQDRWFAELRRWGNNVNQIARRVNSDLMDGWHKEFQQVKQALAKIEKLVVDVYGGSHV